MFVLFNNWANVHFSLTYFSEAKPKMILKKMDVHGLSAGHVASHLQVCFLIESKKIIDNIPHVLCDFKFKFMEFIKIVIGIFAEI